VGEGQCILLQSEGRNFLVDCGGDSRAADIAANHLLSRGIHRLDGLILTHPDRDHGGGVENLLTRVETEVLVHPAEFSAIAAEKILCATREVRMETGNTKITVFPPTYPGTGNEKSLCVLFESEKCAILITGDRSGFGERMLLRTADIRPVDILIAGHHGSKASTCEELLIAVSPEIVCISAGRDNPYGHPAPELLARLQAFGCTVYRTDLHGTITIRR
jgi:competence protein ComEC